MQRLVRVKKELEKLQQNPLPGVTFWPTDNTFHMEASIIGPDSTPYENGVYKLDIQIPERYPFEPPKLRFITPVYHPNIDSSGRICLDVLKMPPNGCWKPSLDLGGLLTSVQLLMSEPNFSDPLMTEIAEEYKTSYTAFKKHAMEWNQKYAVPKVLEQSSKQPLTVKDASGLPSPKRRKTS